MCFCIHPGYTTDVCTVRIHTATVCYEIVRTRVSERGLEGSWHSLSDDLADLVMLGDALREDAHWSELLGISWPEWPSTGSNASEDCFTNWRPQYAYKGALSVPIFFFLAGSQIVRYKRSGDCTKKQQADKNCDCTNNTECP